MFDLLEFAGHNTDGKYFVTSNKLAFRSEVAPRKVQVWIEKSRDGRIAPVLDVEVRDMACGVNHTVNILYMLHLDYPVYDI
jgi:hypothetical protein